MLKCLLFSIFINIYQLIDDTIPMDRQKRLPKAICSNNTEKSFYAQKRTLLAIATLFATPGIQMLL